MNMAQMKDDRARTVPMNAPNESGLAEKRPSFRIHQQAWKAQPRVLIMIGLLSSASYFGASLAIRFAFGRPIFTVDQIGAVCGFAGVILAMTVASHKRKAKLTARFIDECRQAQVCASCGYNLRGLHAEPDNCTLCPECGAAWRLPQHAHQSTEPRP